MLRLATAMAVFLLAVWASRYLTRNGPIDGPLLWILALIPGLALLGGIYAFGRLIIEQKDEFIRMLIIRQWVIATGIALSFAAVWGFLEEFGLVPHIYAYYFAFIWFLGFGLGGVVNRITHGAWGEMS